MRKAITIVIGTGVTMLGLFGLSAVLPDAPAQRVETAAEVETSSLGPITAAEDVAPSVPTLPEVTAATAAPVTVPPAVEASEPRITLAMFQGLALGTSYADVVAAFGSEGQIASTFTILDSVHETRLWENGVFDGMAGYYSVSLGFTDGLLSSMAQFGLE